MTIHRVTPTDLAWLAGVIDTRGLLTWREVRDSSWLPSVHVNNPPMGVNDQLTKLTGTKYTLVKRDYDRKPCSKHCKTAHIHQDSTTTRWSATGARATILLFNIKEYLMTWDAGDLLDKGKTVGYSQSVVDDMIARGYQIPEMKMQPRSRPASDRKLKAV